MHPYVDFNIAKVYVFPIVLVIALFSCLLIFVLSSKYDSFFFPQVRCSFVFSMIGAVVGGKLLFFITRIGEADLSIYDRLNGFVFYGGLLGLMLGIYIYSRVKWNRFTDILDVYASLLPLGQSIGRIGCYFNGCCYGKCYSGFLSVRYLVNGEETTVFPTWFVESFFCLFLFMIMFSISKGLPSGVYSAIYLTSYPVFRFFLEFYRGDAIRGILFGFSTSQYISLILFSLGIVMLISSIKYKDKNLIIVGEELMNEC